MNLLIYLLSGVFYKKSDAVILNSRTMTVHLFPHLQCFFGYSISFYCLLVNKRLVPLTSRAFRSGRLLTASCGSVVTALSPSPAHRGGLPRGTGPRFLPETARLRGVPNRGEGLPPRVSGQLPGGSSRTGHLLHPPPQQTQEIHLPVH